MKAKNGLQTTPREIKKIIPWGRKGYLNISDEPKPSPEEVELPQGTGAKKPDNHPPAKKD